MLSEQFKKFVDEVKLLDVNKKTLANYLDLIEVIKLYESNQLLLAWKRLTLEHKGNLPDDNFIRAIVMSRVAEAAYEQDVAKQIPNKGAIDLARSAFKNARMDYSAASFQANLQIMSLREAPETEESKQAIKNLELVRQYCNSRMMIYEKDIDFTGAADRWKRSPYMSTWNDYTGIHPFFMELCPPHHIWRHYIYNGRVFYLDQDDKLQSVPTAQWDFTKNTPL